VNIRLVDIFRYSFSAFGFSVTSGYSTTKEAAETIRKGLNFEASDDQSYITPVKAVEIDGVTYELKRITIET
jgi:hypothetical protein